LADDMEIDLTGADNTLENVEIDNVLELNFMI
jgi:hypothetical protein